MDRMILGATIAAAGLLQVAHAGAADLKIGLAVAMTGTYAPYSEAEGARCMADKLNKAAGAGDPKVELMIEDNRSDPQLSVSLGQKFLDAGAQVITGVPFPDALIPTAQIAEPYGATVFSAPNTQIEMQQAGLDNFIAGAVPDPINAAATANALYGKGARTVALLVSPDAGSYSEKLPEWFGEVFEHLGGKVVSKLNYSWARRTGRRRSPASRHCRRSRMPSMSAACCPMSASSFASCAPTAMTAGSPVATPSTTSRWKEPSAIRRRLRR
ncbi:exported hypothetical protein [Mesorhizobium metallidurans STM 2683]|uniref:Leucine-binding protein domain-containing protein n=1 Tax=Mesorhizobium metallidurans STM 2683 TaxID=1297569 RepID=M5EV16_9HYPH|nr:exported hypothetical protein [Mesorhizobium metallidurans STM 2683]